MTFFFFFSDYVVQVGLVFLIHLLYVEIRCLPPHFAICIVGTLKAVLLFSVYLLVRLTLLVLISSRVVCSDESVPYCVVHDYNTVTEQRKS